MMEDGIEGVEIDVYLTKDDIPILFHGGDYGEVLKSVPEIGAVASTKIRALTSEQIKAIEIGPNECPPMVEEVIKESKGQLFFNFEIKDPDPKVVPIMLDLVDKYGLWNNCMMSSYNHAHLESFEKLSGGRV